MCMLYCTGVGGHEVTVGSASVWQHHIYTLSIRDTVDAGYTSL